MPSPVHYSISITGRSYGLVHRLAESRGVSMVSIMESLLADLPDPTSPVAPPIRRPTGPRLTDDERDILAVLPAFGGEKWATADMVRKALGGRLDMAAVLYAIGGLMEKKAARKKYRRDWWQRKDAR